MARLPKQCLFATGSVYVQCELDVSFWKTVFGFTFTGYFHGDDVQCCTSKVPVLCRSTVCVEGKVHGPLDEWSQWLYIVLIAPIFDGKLNKYILGGQGTTPNFVSTT